MVSMVVGRNIRVGGITHHERAGLDADRLDFDRLGRSSSRAGLKGPHPDQPRRERNENQSDKQRPKQVTLQPGEPDQPGDEDPAPVTTR